MQLLDSAEFDESTLLALQHNPNDVDAVLSTTKARTQSKRSSLYDIQAFQDEVQALRRAQHLGAGIDIRAYVQLAEHYAADNQDAKAVAELHAGLKVVETAAQKIGMASGLHGCLVCYLAERLIALGDYKGAVRVLRRALELLPASPSILLAMAAAHAQLGDLKKSAHYLTGIEKRLSYLPLKRKRVARRMIEKMTAWRARNIRSGNKEL